MGRGGRGAEGEGKGQFACSRAYASFRVSLTEYA